MRIMVLLFLFVGLLCSKEIKVAVSANVSYAFHEIVSIFYKSYPDIKVLPIISSSGNLTAQIRHGAPFGLFLSADMSYPKKLYELGLAVTKPVVYAKGSLSLISKSSENLSSDIQILTKKGIKSIAIANPDTAPYGKASFEALENAGIYKKVKPKLVYAQNASQALTYTLNATDVGFVAKSALYLPKVKGLNLFFKDVNASLYKPINQGIVMLFAQRKNSDVKAFYDFILSPSAKEIFKKYGYNVDE